MKQTCWLPYFLMFASQTAFGHPVVMKRQPCAHSLCGSTYPVAMKKINQTSPVLENCTDHYMYHGGASISKIIFGDALSAEILNVANGTDVSVPPVTTITQILELISLKFILNATANINGTLGSTVKSKSGTLGVNLVGPFVLYDLYTNYTGTANITLVESLDYPFTVKPFGTFSVLQNNTLSFNLTMSNGNITRQCSYGTFNFRSCDPVESLIAAV